MPAYHPTLDAFKSLADAGADLVPLCRRLMADQITPVLAYRRLTRPDPRPAPSFLLESVVAGDRIGRYSFMGAQPAARIIARRNTVEYQDFRQPQRTQTYSCGNPLHEMHRLTGHWKTARLPEHAGVSFPDFTGGWVGSAGYDTVRYLEGEKLSSPPPDDRNLPDLEMQLYLDVIAFDHVQKSVLVITHVNPAEHPSIDAAYAAGIQRLDALVQRVETPLPSAAQGWELPPGDLDLSTPPPTLPTSNMGQGGYQQAVRKAKQYIAAGDIFQVVPSQRFDIETPADPFDVYRALRVVNPSPYMFYMQIDGAMLVGASPEILCRVHDRVLTNRPLAGTRRRGADQAEDIALERELLADEKDRAEHIMLVDLARNDVGRVAHPGSIQLPAVMAIERFSHVMHISSTVTGRLRDECTCWDALRYALPVGTVSGAPKVRAMQIIDELEPARRGPYAGAVGYADLHGNMDMAIALRTMVITPAPSQAEQSDADADQRWIVAIQAGGGIVADSDPDAEHQETVNKAAAMAKSVHLAEHAFTA